MRIPTELICTRIPAYIVPEWIEYCTSRKLTQSEAMRRAIAHFIYNDEAATNRELALGAVIEDAFPEKERRSHGRSVNRNRMLGLIVQEAIDSGKFPVSPSP